MNGLFLVWTPLPSLELLFLMGTLDHNFGLCEDHFVGKTTMKKNIAR